MCSNVNFLISVILLANSLFTTSAGSSCINPNQKKGYCISIQECPVLRALSLRSPRTEDDNRFLKACSCTNGFGEPPFVCCTEDSQFQFKEASFRIQSELLPSIAECGDQPSGSKIYSGKETELDEFPWMALLNYGTELKPQFFCGGSLINSRYVLTAAHCVVDKNVHSIRLGEYDTTKPIDCIESDCADPPIDVSIDSIIIHPNYNMKSIHRHNDIALIRLKNEVNYSSFIAPICLPSVIGLTRSEIGTNLVAAGWGRTLNEKRSNIKLKVSLPVSSEADCQKAYRRTRNILVDSQMCAGGKFIQDACDGDSGGPLMFFKGKWAMEGIVSFSRGCGLENQPGVYTRVVDYENWIRANLKP